MRLPRVSPSTGANWLPPFFVTRLGTFVLATESGIMTESTRMPCHTGTRLSTFSIALRT
jgi:hypothetical protein